MVLSGMDAMMSYRKGSGVEQGYTMNEQAVLLWGDRKQCIEVSAMVQGSRAGAVWILYKLSRVQWPLLTG